MHVPSALRRFARTHAVLALGWPGQALPQDPFPAAGHWEGAIELPDLPLVVRVDLAHTEHGWSGTIDLPQQDAEGLALADVLVAGDALSFRIADVPGDPRFDGRLAAAEVRGTFRQGDLECPFRLGRDAVAPALRAQDPRPPFPYRTEEVTVRSGDVVLAATLTLPPGQGPFPAAVLVTGSGAQDRDEALAGHRPFLVLADHLARAGIAVLRADDRGVGGSTGSTSESTSADFARDALAGVHLLAARAEIDAQRIGLVGHSEGGMVAPLAAVQDEGVAWLVLLAGPGVPVRALLPRQVERLALAEGLGAEDAAEQGRLMGEVLDVLAADPPADALRAGLRELALQQAALEGEVDPAAVEAALEEGLAEVTTPWFRYFAAYDPRPTLERVRVPVLALNGTLDTQVDAAQNLPEILAALARGGNCDATAVALPGLNHLFQHATTGGPGEYRALEETLAPEVLDRIARWIAQR